jgi:osmotically-inducible protein OsmY
MRPHGQQEVATGQQPACAQNQQMRPEKSTLEDQICSNLRASPYHSVRNVACRLRNGVLTLSGQVPTFFQKQISQSIVLKLVSENVRVDNQVHVIGPYDSSGSDQRVDTARHAFRSAPPTSRRMIRCLS